MREDEEITYIETRLKKFDNDMKQRNEMRDAEKYGIQSLF